MISIAGVDMNEVTRLTRAGRLADATALLQSGLGRGLSTAAPTRGETRSMELGSVGGGRWRLPAGRSQHPRLALVADAGPKPRAIGAIAGSPRAEPTELFPQGASFETRTVANAAGVLDYKLYVPSGRAQAPISLVVMLHGCMQNADDFAAGTRMNELAAIYGFLVAYPVQTKAANASRCWNWFKDSEQIRDRGEPSLIADATRQILAEHQVDPQRVFVAGLSAGGAAAAIMGCSYPDIYAGVGVHSGLACGAASDLPSAFQAMRNGAGRKTRPSSTVPTIVFHGGADRTVGASNASEVVAQVVTRSGPATVERGTSDSGITFVRTVRRDPDGRAVSEQWIVEGGRHAWFGGSPKGSYTDPRGPDASREMLRFFGIVPNAV